MTISLVMNQQPLQELATGATPAKTLQEKSNEIEQLADAIAALPQDAARDKRFAFLNFGKVQWSRLLPWPGSCWIGAFAMAREGVLWECLESSPGSKMGMWKIVSDGLRLALDEQPHTYGFAQMDAELITDHVRDSVREWLTANFSEEQISEVIEQLKIEVEDRQPTLNYSSCLILLSRLTDLLRRISPTMCDSLRASDRLACRISPLMDLHNGMHQSLALTSALIDQAATLCTDAVNPSQDCPVCGHPITHRIGGCCSFLCSVENLRSSHTFS